MQQHEALNIALGVVMLMAGFMASACASEAAGQQQRDASSPAAADRLLEFDIPSQSLADALAQYGILTRRPTLYRSEIVVGLASSAVKGRYPPEMALHLLLAGTGLVAQKTAAGPDESFVLKKDAAAESRRTVLADAGNYPVLLQARIWQALCSSARTAPGGYRSLLRFQVDAGGRIQHARLLSSTGDAGRDKAVLETLDQMRIDTPPPPDMLQPLTMAILPNGPGVELRCDIEG